jgi:hypothetical protein
MYYKNNIIYDSYVCNYMYLKLFVTAIQTVLVQHRATRTVSALLDTAWRAVIGRLEPYQSPETGKKQAYKPVKLIRIQ